jgi:hypothetical protein
LLISISPRPAAETTSKWRSVRPKPNFGKPADRKRRDVTPHFRQFGLNSCLVHRNTISEHTIHMCSSERLLQVRVILGEYQWVTFRERRS